MAADSAIKVVLMGQGGVGKTAMTLRYTTGDFNEQYLPTIGDMYTKDVEVNGAPRHVQIDDTAGQEAYADLKNEKLGTGDGYLLVYSITDDTTFGVLDRVREEILKAQAARGKPMPPIFLIGTKADLEADRAVSGAEREAKAREWGTRSFEVSSKTDEGVAGVFTEIIKAVLTKTVDPNKGGGGGSVMGAGRTPARKDTTPDKKKKCSIM
jgi:small GTP-binding protein